MRPLLALVVAACSAALAAVILGEYELAGFTPVVSGVMLALVIGEVAVTVAGRRDLRLGAACGVMVAASVLWAGWLSAARNWDFFPGGAWVGAAVGALTAVAWVAPRSGVRSSGPPADDSPPGP